MNLKLLLLEDDPVSGLFLQTATAALPARVELATTLQAAHAIAVTGDHDLWLFDVNLPDGTGSQLLARLREAGLVTPALAHTAQSSADERARLLADGFSGVAVKPLPAEQWQAAIRNALEPPSTDPVAMPGSGRRHEHAIWDDTAAARTLGGNPAHVQALRDLFVDEIPSVGTRIDEAVAAGRLQSVRDELHRLRASCGFVGAARLLAAAEALHAEPQSPPALEEFRKAIHRTTNTPYTR